MSVSSSLIAPVLFVYMEVDPQINYMNTTVCSGKRYVQRFQKPKTFRREKRSRNQIKSVSTKGSRGTDEVFHERRDADEPVGVFRVGPRPSSGRREPGASADL